MKKNLSINIRGILLYIEEDGYELLQNYLHKVNTYFAGYEGSKDIVEDIETRIAEIFMGKLDSYKQVITLEDVQALMAQMGDVTDFEIVDDPSEHIHNNTIQEKEISPKKLFRDEENKILAGVSSGLAAYFGGGELIFRILFIILAFMGGLGIIIYATLWFAVPAAKTITDKVAMKGEPITLNNIENSIKNALEVKKEDNKLVKFFMAPFYLLARVIEYLQPKVNAIFNYTGKFFSKLIGISLSGFALLSFATATLVAFITLRWVDGNSYWDSDVPLDVMLNSIENLNWLTFICYLGIVCLTVMFFLLGVSILLKRRTFNNSLLWSLAGTTFVCVIFFLLLIPQTAVHFRKDYSIEKEERFSANKNKVITFTINAIERNYYNEDFIDIKGYDGNDIKIIRMWEASGKSKEEALKHIEMVDYQIVQKDSFFVFDNHITYKKDARFRNQDLSIKILVPYNQKFTFSKGFQQKTSIYSQVAYSDSDAATKKVWLFTSKGLECEGCDNSTTVSLNSDDLKKFTLAKFKEVEIKGNIRVEFKPSTNFEVKVSSDLTKVDVQNDKLIIQSHTKQDVQVIIYAPTIEKISLSDYAEGLFEMPFVNRLELNVSNHSSAELNGKSDILKITADNHSNVNAFEWHTQEALIDLNKNSEASIYVEKKLSITAKQNSHLSYTGEPSVSSSVSQSSSINQQ